MNKKWFLFVFIISGILLLRVTPAASQPECGFIVGTWHPTDDLFAINCNNTAYIYTSELELIQTLAGPTDPVDSFPEITELAWSPNGRYLAASIVRTEGDSSASRLVVWEVSTAAIVLDIPQRKAPIAWSPDSRLIAADSLYRPDALYFYDLTTGSEIGQCAECNGAIDVDWNPTNIHQFVISHSSETVFVDPLSANISPNIIPGISFIGGYSLDGRKLIFYNYDEHRIEVRDSYSRQIVATLPFTTTGPINAIFWLSNGIYISNTSGITLRWDIASQQISNVVIEEATPILWKPDGTMYFLADRNGVSVRDTKTGSLKGQLLVG